jgi:hypothetical protein
MENQMRAHRVNGHAWVLTGAEYNEEQILRYWASRSEAIVLILPAGGTTYYGGLIQAMYDVRVFEVRSGDKEQIVWRGRINAGSGAVEEWFDQLAEDLVTRLVADGVLPHRTQEEA